MKKYPPDRDLYVGPRACPHCKQRYVQQHGRVYWWIHACPSAPARPNSVRAKRELNAFPSQPMDQRISEGLRVLEYAGYEEMKEFDFAGFYQ